MMREASATQRFSESTPLEQGSGRVEWSPNHVRLLRATATSREYSNAQIGDNDRASRWHPPLILSVRARFSHPIDRLRGTAGFGFWNAAIAPNLSRLRPPQTVWFFFGGAPHDMPLARGVPGNGFKAAVLDTQRLAFFALLPTAPLGFLLMRIPAVYERLWPIAQRAIGAEERSLNDLDLTTFHTYSIDWRPTTVRFAVDGCDVLTTSTAPRGPLGFCMWIDNSYAVVTPTGRFAYGLSTEPAPQWLDVEAIEIRSQTTGKVRRAILR